MKVNPVVISKFKGLNTATSDWALEDNELSEATNVIITEQGTIKRRKGIFRGNAITGVGQQAYSLCRFKTASIDVNIIASNNGVHLVANDSSVVSSDGGTHVSCAVQYNDIAFVFSYITEQMMTFSASGVKTLNQANFQATEATVHKARCFIANNRSSINPSVVRFSELYTVSPWLGASGWPTNNTIDIQPGDGDTITAIVDYNDSLLVFKTSSTWVIYTDGNPSQWTVKKLHNSIGCVGRDTPTIINNLVYFQSATAVYRTDGTTFEEISRPIQNVFQLYTSTDPSVINYNSATYWNGLWIMNPDPASIVLYVFNTYNDTWTKWVPPTNFGRFQTYPTSSANTFRVPEFRTTAGTVELWSGDSVSPYYDNTVSSHVPYSSFVTFKPQDLGLPSVRKRNVSTDVELSDTAVDARPLTLELLKDGIVTSSTKTSGGNFTTSCLYRFKGAGWCRYLTPRLNTNAEDPMEINSISLNMIPSKSNVGRNH